MASFLQSIFSSSKSSSTGAPNASAKVKANTNTTSNSNSKATARPRSKFRIKGHSYDSAIASDPPVKGSYPVAGNGPAVLEDLQRSRAQTRSSNPRRESSEAAADAPNVPRTREDILERPQTAPAEGTAGGRHSNGGWAGRRQSGILLKSPSIFRSSSSSRNDRRGSMPATVTEPPPPLPAMPRLVSTSTTTTPRPQTYQPKKWAPGEPGELELAGYTPPPAPDQHIRNNSTSSHRSYVDLLEAQSSIWPENSNTTDKAKASGTRRYGEDVADRNIERFRAPSFSFSSNPNTSPLDLDSPQFSYLKTVYAPKKGSIADAPVNGVGPHSRTASARGHVMGDDNHRGDSPPRSHGKSPSRRSAPRPRLHPLRTEATSPALSLPYTTTTTTTTTTNTGQGQGRSRARDDDRPSSPKAPSSQDQRARALSSQSQANPAQSSDQQSVMRKSLRNLIYPKQQSSSQPEGREWTAREPPLVAPAIAKPRSSSRADTTASSIPTNSGGDHAVQRMPARPVSNESTVDPGASVKSKTDTNGHRSSKSGSVSYSPFPNSGNRPGNRSPTDRADLTGRASRTSITNRPQETMLEISSVPPNLDGVVDLHNTVDTDVTTKTLPAVTHEHVTPAQHEIRQERIIREIHTHEVRHHLLPVIDTEILPAKHYIRSPDGKGLVEIPEPRVSAHKPTGTMNGDWMLAQTSIPPHTQPFARYQDVPEDYEGAEAPVIGLARGDPVSRSRASSHASSHVVKHSRSSKNLFTEPVLASKKEYMTAEGYPRTEYLWRHPPVFEDAMGRTQPIRSGASFGYPNSPPEQFFEDSLGGSVERYKSAPSFKDGIGEAAERSAVLSVKSEDSLLFRDSGYGSGGMLPGLSTPAPTADSIYTNGGTVSGGYGAAMRLGRGLDDGTGRIRAASNGEGEATTVSKRMQERERRRSSAANKSTGSSLGRASVPYGEDLARGLRGLQF